MEDFKELFLLLKEYIDKQKENMTLGAAESLTKVLSALIIGAIMFSFGCIILLLACIALALLIGNCTGSAALGFASVAGMILVLILVLVQPQAVGHAVHCQSDDTSPLRPAPCRG